MRKNMLFWVAVIISLNVISCQENVQQKDTSGQASQNEVFEKIDVAQLKAMITENSQLQLIDVRTPKEYSDGYIGKAKNINFFDDDFTTQVSKKLDKNKPVVLYCRSGRRSANAALKLKDLGFKQIYDLNGGILSWKE